MARAAKKRKRKEEPEFTLPKFDEVEYMRKEVEGAKTAFVTIAYAVPAALLSFALTIAGVPVVAFFVGLALAFLLPRVMRILPWPPVDISKFERKDWLGHGATFFFAWLAFWILLLNPPFGDQTAPTIAAVSVNGTPVQLVQNAQVDVKGSNVTINATVLENVALDEVVFTVNGVLYGPPELSGPVSTPRGPVYTLRLEDPAGFSVTILARDTSGNTASFSFQVRVT